MPRVSVQELKQSLSAWLARAEAGELVVVTRHGRPLVRIVAAEDPKVRVRGGFGKTSLHPVVADIVAERALAILDEDRGRP